MTSVHALASFREETGAIHQSDVIRALKTLGGAAHRDLIADVVSGSLAGRKPIDQVRNSVEDILRGDSPKRGSFKRVWADSHRWALVD